MDKFIVSARKYRPATFESVVGQQHITTTLKNAISSNHLAQAFLFCGPRGVGKTTNARILAKTINCTNLTPEVEACDECESCRAFNNNASFNVHELDAASNNSVEDIRNLVDQVRYAPQSGKYKVYIIDEVHMLSNQAFNAFLKTLEEPPEYAIFILATTEKHKIIPTILSRCQIFDFNRIQVKDIADHLAQIAQKEGVQAEEEALRLIAQKADGALRDALSIFDLMVTFSGNSVTYKDVIDNLHILDYDYYFRLTDCLLAEEMSEALLIFDEILKKGFDGHNFVAGLAGHFRDLMVCKDAATAGLLDVSENVRQRFAAQAQQASLSFLLSALNIASQYDLNYKSAKNQRLHVELMLMKLAHLGQAVDLVQNGAPASKKKTDGGNGVNQKNSSDAAAGQSAVGQAAPEESKPEVETVRGRGTVSSHKPISDGIRPMASSKKMRSTVKIPSFNTLMNASKEEENVQEEQANYGAEEKANNPFTFQQLTQVWVEFSRELEKQGNMSWVGVIKQPFRLDAERNLITLTLSNTVQVDLLENFRMELMSFLKKRLNNYSLQLESEVAIEKVAHRPYTPKEKFNHLAKKKPELLELQKRLGLDPEF